MLSFSPLSARYETAMQDIEARSNPFPLSQASLLSSFKNYEAMGAFVDDKLVAFVLYRIIAGEGEIIHLVCDVDEQGKGYARQLLAEAIFRSEDTQGVRCWHLEVRCHNRAAIKVYTGLGFTDVGVRKSYYRNGDDALLMRLDCTSENAP